MLALHKTLKMAPNPGPITQTKNVTVYFRKIQNDDPAHRSPSLGQMKPPTYVKTEDTIDWPYIVYNDPEKKPAAIPISTKPEAFQEMLKKHNGKDSIIQWLPRTIRYVFGMQTIFKDEQEPNGRAIDQSVLDRYTHRDALVMTDNEIRIPSTDIVRINFLECMNQCENQHFLARRSMNVKPFYRKLDFASQDREKALMGQKREEAFKLARDARNQDMLIHAKYLRIPFVIAETGEDRDMAAIKEDYKDFAYNKPEMFLATFSDPIVKLAYWVQDMLDKKHIVVKNGNAIWNGTQAPITAVPEGKPLVDFLSSYALTEEGEAFGKQIQAFKLTQLQES